MAKIDLTDLVNLQNEATAVTSVNNNNTSIETALENTVSRDGTTPNQMGADFDMNSHRILNLPAPAGLTEPLRVTDALGSLSTVTALTGTSGHAVPFLDGTNTWSGGNTFSAALTYGGVTLSNAVTGTGNMVLSVSPTFTGTVTAAAANYSGTVTFGTGTITALTADTTPDPAADFLLTYDNSATAFKKVKPINLSQGFSANKNGTDQTGIATGTFTKITFTTEAFDVGGYYDNTNSKWTPPAGIILISTVCAFSSVTSGSTNYVIIYKNGSRFKDAISSPGNISSGNTLVVIDQANGTDYYEVYVFLGTSSTATVTGNPPSNTYFSGKIL